jgi:5'-deoxynucleotidase YfbR-like HD superfamily hydrolase
MNTTELIEKNGRVTRYHTERVLHPETIAEHSWGVAMLCIALTNGNPSMNLLKAALYHDLAEHVTGDTPAPAKWNSPKLKEALTDIEWAFHKSTKTEVELTDDEMEIFKMADMLQLCIYCQSEWSMGNRTLTKIWHNGWDWLYENFQLPSLVLQIHLDQQEARNGRK